MRRILRYSNAFVFFCTLILCWYFDPSFRNLQTSAPGRCSEGVGDFEQRRDRAEGEADVSVISRASFEIDPKPLRASNFFRGVAGSEAHRSRLPLWKFAVLLKSFLQKLVLKSMLEIHEISTNFRLVRITLEGANYWPAVLRVADALCRGYRGPGTP